MCWPESELRWHTLHSLCQVLLRFRNLVALAMRECDRAGAHSASSVFGWRYVGRRVRSVADRARLPQGFELGLSLSSLLRYSWETSWDGGKQ